MMLLNVPLCHQAMTVSVSMTGITVLKESRYKARHAGSKEIVQVPMKGFDLRKNQLNELNRGKSKKKVQKKDDSIPKIPLVKSTRKSSYSINKKEVTHRIRGFVNQMKGEPCLYFWTVTFHPSTSDDIAFILLNKWLTRLRKEGLLKSYLWITERQEIGTIHFHIAINQRVDVKKANRYMRACLFTCIDKGEISYSREEAKNYNGVDIAKDRKTRRVINFAKGKKARSLVNYLTKYVTKNDGVFKHLAWHSSRDYSNIIIAIRFTMKEWEDSKTGQLINYQKTFSSEWYEWYGWAAGPPGNVLKYLREVNQYAQSILFG